LNSKSNTHPKSTGDTVEKTVEKSIGGSEMGSVKKFGENPGPD
jgi:hypothetical protein